MSQCDYCGSWFSNSIIDAHMALHKRYRSTVIGLELEEYDENDDFNPFARDVSRESSLEARHGIGYRGGQSRTNDDVEAKLEETMRRFARMSPTSDLANARTSEKSTLKLTTLQGETIKPSKPPFKPAPTQRKQCLIRITCPACQASVAANDLVEHKETCTLPWPTPNPNITTGVSKSKKKKAKRVQAVKQVSSLAS